MARAYRSNNKNQESLAGIALIGLAYAVILFFQNANMVFVTLFGFSVLQTIIIVINSSFKIYQQDEESLYENLFFLFLVSIGVVLTYILAKFVPTDLTEIYKDFKITDFIFGKKLTIYGIGLSFDIIVSVAILGLYQIFNAYLMIKKVLQGYFFESQSHIYKVQGNRTTKPLKSKNRLNCEQKGEPSCSPIRLTI